MPVKFVCHNCGYVLYEGREPIEPRLVAARYHYRCPKCFAPLSKTPLSIRITPNRRVRPIR